MTYDIIFEFKMGSVQIDGCSAASKKCEIDEVAFRYWEENLGPLRSMSFNISCNKNNNI